MKSPIHSIPQLYRNLRRWTEIISILSKYGLANWISRLRIDFVKDSLKSAAGESLARLSHEKRVRLALTELGPTFVKLGQLLSTRPDVVGAELAQELTLLQDQVDPEDFRSIRRTVEQELGSGLDELFVEIDSEPTAAASIGQVHRARLHDGSVVAVKVQRSDVASKIRNDLEILSGLGQLAERIDELKPYRPKEIVSELTRSLRRELDFGREERNLFHFHSKFEKSKLVNVPRPITDLSTPKVITMEFADGMKLTDRDTLISSGVDTDKLARDLVELNIQLIFDDGFFHADPHPGNILVDAQGSITLLDFGLVGRIGESHREDIEEMLYAIFSGDSQMLTSTIGRICEFPPRLDETTLENDLTEFVSQYSSRALSEFAIGNVLNSMFEIIRQHQLKLPTDAILLLRVLITLDGSVRILSPDFRLMDVLKPLHRKMLYRRFSPSRQIRKLRRMGIQFEKMAETMPRKLAGIIDQIRSGKIDINLDHRKLGSSVNRLVLGMVISALFLGSAIMLAQKAPPLMFAETSFLGLHQISILGIFGCFMSFLLGCRLFWAILNSGSFDRPD